jgi:hypothetical protein
MKYLGWLGMLINIVSYFLTVNGFPAVGIPMAATGCIVYGFYAFRVKVWNLLVLQIVFLVVNATGIIHLFTA